MQAVADHTDARVAIRTDLGAIFVSLELSRSKWLVTSISPGAGEKMSKFDIRAGDISALLARFRDLQRKAEARTGQGFGIVSIQEAGLDGFWIHRVLEREGVENYIVDPASIATSRRRRRAKPIGLMVRHWFGPCWPISAASREFAPCFVCLLRKMKTAAARCGSAKRCSTRE